MFFCCSFESRDKQMLQHFKTFIFSKRQLSTYLHAQPLKPHTSDKSMSIMYQVPFRRSLSYSLFLQQNSHARSVTDTAPVQSWSQMRHLLPPAFTCSQQSQPLAQKRFFIYIYIYMYVCKQLKARPKVYLSSILWVLAIVGHRTHWLRLRHSICCDIGYRASGKVDGTNLP